MEQLFTIYLFSKKISLQHKSSDNSHGTPVDSIKNYIGYT